jgi:hypothetical protein
MVRKITWLIEEQFSREREDKDLSLLEAILCQQRHQSQDKHQRTEGEVTGRGTEMQIKSGELRTSSQEDLRDTMGRWRKQRR